MFVAAAYIVRGRRWMELNNQKIKRFTERTVTISLPLSVSFSLLFPVTSSFLSSPELKLQKPFFTKDFDIWQMAIHSRGFFSDLRFPSAISLESHDSFPTAERGRDEVSLPFYLCLYSNLRLYVFFSLIYVNKTVYSVRKQIKDIFKIQTWNFKSW